MPENSWSENESNTELDPLSSLLSELSDPEEEEEEFRSDFFQGLAGRRRKAAFVLISIWSVTIALHLVSWGIWVIVALSLLLFIHLGRLFLARPQVISQSTASVIDLPSLSLLVAAKNEEAVIASLVKMLFAIDYPADKYEVWIVDDRSTDKTPEILERLSQEYKQLKVLRRPDGAGGGKSGALNQALSLTKGDIVGVFDADAKVPQDLLTKLVPVFAPEKIGGVQVRKAIANASVNFWTQGQKAEMAIDNYFQQKRIAIGGIGELRGNGQFVRRSALNSCGGWNEQTITDDLDLTIRLHLDHWDIGVLEFPAVGEEGVTTAIALWHQRNRWAEGGYQRYLDYWRFILSNRLSFNKKLDLMLFFFSQYIISVAAIPDFLMVIYRHHFPLVAPLTTIVLSFSFWGMFVGLQRTDKSKKPFLVGLESIRGIIYMLHWFVIMPCITFRMSIRPKRLKWVKTIHGNNQDF